MVVWANLVGALWKAPTVVAAVHDLRQVLLFDVIDADGSFSGILSLGQSRQEKAG